MTHGYVDSWPQGQASLSPMLVLSLIFDKPWSYFLCILVKCSVRLIEV